MLISGHVERKQSLTPNLEITCPWAHERGFSRTKHADTQIKPPPHYVQRRVLFITHAVTLFLRHLRPYLGNDAVEATQSWISANF